MSTYEYNDLFLKCQSTGIYHMFTFDIKNSKRIENGNWRMVSQIRLILNMYRKIQEKEILENKTILVFEDGFRHFGEGRCNEFGFKEEPFVYGDMIGLTVYRNSITKEEILKIFEEEKEYLQMDYDFHIADGYYETNNWVEGNEKYFREYCMKLLSNMHKPYNKYIRKELVKQKLSKK